MDTRSMQRSMPLLALAACVLLNGCSTMYVDDAGRRHVIGFVAMTLPPVDPAATGAEALRTRAFGLTLTRSPVGSALVLGYSDETFVSIRNDSAVPLNGWPAP